MIKYVNSLLRILLLIISAIIFVYPIIYLIGLSFSSVDGVNGGYVDWFLGNWYALFSSKWVGSLWNSFLITIPCIILTILITFPAGYVFSRYRFLADKHIFFWFLMNRMTPASAMLLPYLIIYLRTGLYNTIQGVIIAYFVFNVPLGIWLFTSFMGMIPKEIDEQAFIDGYGLLKYFEKIFIPLCKPAIGVVSFFIWYQSWSEMFIASLITTYDTMPLNARLFMLLDRVGRIGDPGIVSAVGVITLIPGMVMLYWARRYLAKGFTFGKI
ncbi:MAG: carbohydrate ABC transporter permease [Nitrososphaeria archaeon]